MHEQIMGAEIMACLLWRLMRWCCLCLPGPESSASCPGPQLPVCCAPLHLDLGSMGAEAVQVAVAVEVVNNCYGKRSCEDLACLVWWRQH